MRDSKPDLDVEYVFCDTHKELPETYEYLVRIEAYLGKPVVRLCSNLGERGFDHWLQLFRGYLPSPSVRWCTKQLKIKPFEQFVGDDSVNLYVGIRADEDRVGYISTKENITPVYPLKEAGFGINDVRQILTNSIVSLPEYYTWRSRSGCYFCFFQRKIEWIGLLEHHPDLFEKAKAYEKSEEGFTWNQRESLAELARSERIAQIREEDLKRRERIRKSRSPHTLMEMFAPEFFDPEEENGCLICQK